MIMYYSISDILNIEYAPLIIANNIPNNNLRKDNLLSQIIEKDNKPLYYFSLIGLLIKNHLYNYIFKVNILEDQETKKERNNYYGWAKYYEEMGINDKQVIETDNAREYLRNKLFNDVIKSNSLLEAKFISNWNMPQYLLFTKRILEEMIIDEGGFGNEIDKLLSKAIDLLEKRALLFGKYYAIYGSVAPVLNSDFIYRISSSKAFDKEEFKRYFENDNGLQKDLQNYCIDNNLDQKLFTILENVIGCEIDSSLNKIHSICRLMYSMHNLQTSYWNNHENSNMEFIDLQLESAKKQAQYIEEIINQ